MEHTIIQWIYLLNEINTAPPSACVFFYFIIFGWSMHSAKLNKRYVMEKSETTKVHLTKWEIIGLI